MSQSEKILVLVSQFWMGHIPAYHRHYEAVFTAHGWRVVTLAATPPAAPAGVGRRSSASTAALRRAARRVLSMLGILSTIQALAWCWRIRRCARAQHLQHPTHLIAVFFVFLDGIFLESRTASRGLKWLLRFPWAGVVNRPAVIRGVPGTFPGTECVLDARACRAVVVLDDAFVEPCRRSWPGKAVVMMPEFADVTPPDTDDPGVLAMRRFAGNRHVVLLAGVMGEKKNVRTLIAVAQRALAAGEPFVFVFAGAFSPDWCGRAEHAALAPLLMHPPENCWCVLEPIAEGATFNAWVAAADVVWVAYRDLPYKGNLFTKAAYFRKPVVVSAGGLMAGYTCAHRLGTAIPLDDPDAALAAIRKLAGDQDIDRDFAGFQLRHDAARLDETAREVSARLES